MDKGSTYGMPFDWAEDVDPFTLVVPDELAPSANIIPSGSTSPVIERVWGPQVGGVYGGGPVRNVCGKAYLSMELVETMPIDKNIIAAPMHQLMPMSLCLPMQCLLHSSLHQLTGP